MEFRKHTRDPVVTARQCRPQKTETPLKRGVSASQWPRFNPCGSVRFRPVRDIRPVVGTGPGLGFGLLGHF